MYIVGTRLQVQVHVYIHIQYKPHKRIIIHVIHTHGYIYMYTYACTFSFIFCLANVSLLALGDIAVQHSSYSSLYAEFKRSENELNFFKYSFNPLDSSSSWSCKVFNSTQSSSQSWRSSASFIESGSEGTCLSLKSCIILSSVVDSELYKLSFEVMSFNKPYRIHV